MWRRDVCSWPPEWWGSKPEDWHRRRFETWCRIDNTITEWRAKGWSDACIGEAIRDQLEGIEVCGINIELLNRTGSFDDPAWIERRSLAAREELASTDDPLWLPGCRKIVRKWNEEIMRFQAIVRIKSRLACGNREAAEAAFYEFDAWMKRPDRKAFDKTG
jgi:hypothetical protein